MSAVQPRVLERVRERVAAGHPATAAGIAELIRAEGVVLDGPGGLRLAEQLQAELTGAGPLAALLALPDVTDVLVNGAGAVFVDRGAGLLAVDLELGGEAEVRRLAQRLLGLAGRRIDDACPFGDGALPDGTRVHAVLAPIACGGTALSLRVARRRRLTLAALAAAGTVSAGLARWLPALMQARLSFLVSGGAGTGKTTLLGALLELVPADERIVLVEDVAEVRCAHPHLVRLQARPGNVEGAGAISAHDLVRQALRMRPDRLLVGEVRGPEVLDLLAALNTGHRGGGGTVHANAAATVPARMEALGTAAGLTRAGLHAQLAAAVEAVIHVERGPRGRRVTGIAVPERAQDGLVSLVPAVECEGGRLRAGPGLRRLRQALRAAAVEPPQLPR